MRTDLKINYFELEEISTRIGSYHNALENMEDTLKNLKIFLENQESEAVSELKSKVSDVNIDVGKKKNTIKQLEKVLNSYITDMRSFVNAASEGQHTRVDTIDIWSNFKELEIAIGLFGLNHMQALSSGYSYVFGDDDEAKAKRQKQERNYQKVEKFRSQEMVKLAQRLVKKNEQIRDIKDKYINPFEKMDDEYRDKINKIYNDCTSFVDKFSNFGDFIENITNAFIEKFVIAFAIALVVALVPGGVLLAGILIVGAGCVVMTAVPEEYVPEWLMGAKKIAEEVTGKAIECMQDPTVLITDIGQGVMDTVQTPEGITGLSGELVGGFAGAKVGMTIKDQIRVPKSHQVERAGGATGTSGVADELTISARNSGKGNPNAIKHFDVDLNNRQTKLLAELPGTDSKVVVSKKDVSLKDLSALTAKTGDEYAMFTRGSQRMIIRGNKNAVNIDGKVAKEMASAGYKWSGHTHPGNGANLRFASDGDMFILKQFGQKQSAIYDNSGNYNIFESWD